MPRSDLDIPANGPCNDMLDKLAAGLRWFSLGLGLVESLGPRAVTCGVGLEGREEFVQAYGLREISAGAGTLATRGPARAPWMWGRVAGDLLDIATVASAMGRRGAPTGRIGLALAALAGVTLADAWWARRLSERAVHRRHDFPELTPPSSDRSDYVRSFDVVETVAPDEEAPFDRIIAVMAVGGERLRACHGRAPRSSHTKAHGLLRGELRVAENRPRGLRQGLFAEARSYPVVVRLAQVPGERPDDRRISTPRGMAIQVLDVAGQKLPLHAGETTQDFVPDTGKVFISATARTFLAAIAGTDAAVPLPEVAKGAVPCASHAANGVLNVIGLNSAKLDLYDHAPSPPGGNLLQPVHLRLRRPHRQARHHAGQTRAAAPAGKDPSSGLRERLAKRRLGATPQSSRRVRRRDPVLHRSRPDAGRGCERRMVREGQLLPAGLAPRPAAATPR